MEKKKTENFLAYLFFPIFGSKRSDDLVKSEFFFSSSYTINKHNKTLP